jgi:hypothetical protein
MLVRARVDVFDQQLPVVSGHLAIMLAGDGIGRAFGALLEHFRLLPEYRRI